MCCKPPLPLPLAPPASRVKTAFMTDQLPDRLCVDPDSPFHDADLLQQEIGVRFNGVEKTNVEEYCISEGWIKVAAGKALDRKGKPLTLKLKGQVEAWIKTADEG
jgi:hypothetical protein